MLRLLVKGGWPVQFSGPGGVYLDCTPKMGNLATIWPCNSCTVSYINDEEVGVGYRLLVRIYRQRQMTASCWGSSSAEQRPMRKEFGIANKAQVGNHK